MIRIVSAQPSFEHRRDARDFRRNLILDGCASAIRPILDTNESGISLAARHGFDQSSERRGKRHRRRAHATSNACRVLRFGDDAGQRPSNSGSADGATA